MVRAMSRAKSARSRSRGLALSIALALAAAAGCGSADNRPATWSFISTAIVQPGCATANCHSALAARAFVDLSTREVGYNTLTVRHFVIPGSADSEMLTLMHAQGSLRMPPDEPLPEVDIQLIERWIVAGAAND
jgi:hypothetical protein